MQDIWSQPDGHEPGVIEYKRYSGIDRYEVLLRISILACNTAAWFTNMSKCTLTGMSTS